MNNNYIQEYLDHLASTVLNESNQFRENSFLLKKFLGQMSGSTNKHVISKNILFVLQAFSECSPKDNQSLDTMKSYSSASKPITKSLNVSGIEKAPQSIFSSLNLSQITESLTIELIDSKKSTIEKFPIPKNQSVLFNSEIKFSYYSNLVFIQCKRGSSTYYSTSKFHLTKGDKFLIGKTEVLIEYDKKLRPELRYVNSSGNETCLNIKKDKFLFGLNINEQLFIANSNTDAVVEIFKLRNVWKIKSLNKSPCIWKQLYNFNSQKFDYSLPLIVNKKHTYRLRSVEFKVQFV